MDKQFVPGYFEAMPARLAELRAAVAAEVAQDPAALTLNGHATPPNGHAAATTSPNGHAQRQNGQGPFPHASHPLLSGGTDLLVQQLDTLREQPVRLLLDQGHHRGLRCEGGRVVLGAATTATQLLESSLLRQLLPGLPGYLKLVSSTPIRNIGTVAGNFVNASPIGDLTIMFLALGADVTLTDPAGRARTVPLAELYLGYKKLAKEPHEQVTEISFPAPLAGDLFHFEKVSKRTHLDIASVNTACWLRLENGTISAARLSAGGVGPVPLLLRRTGEYLLGRELSAATLAGANEVMQTEISPISDVRGTAAYKRLLLRQLLWAHFAQFGLGVEMGEWHN